MFLRNKRMSEHFVFCGCPAMQHLSVTPCAVTSQRCLYASNFTYQTHIHPYRDMTKFIDSPWWTNHTWEHALGNMSAYTLTLTHMRPCVCLRGHEWHRSVLTVAWKISQGRREISGKKKTYLFLHPRLMSVRAHTHTHTQWVTMAHWGHALPNWQQQVCGQAQERRRRGVC